MNKYASLYLTKLAATLNPDDVVVPQKDRGLFGGVVSDFLLLPESQRRSGRISGMQEAAGIEPTMTQRYPLTARLLKTFVGTGIGAGLGSLIGSSFSNNDPYGTNVLSASFAGAGIGGTLANVIDVIQKRRAEAEALKQVSESDDVNLRRIEKGNILASLVSGMHQKGRGEVAKALSGGQIKKDIKFDQIPMTASSFIHPLPVAIGSAFNYAKSRKEIDKANRVSPLSVQLTK